MHDRMKDFYSLMDDDVETVLATVVRTFSSAPRPPGATMLVQDDGSVLGSVSGGCVEADVYAVAEDVLSSGVPALQRYGVSDDVALGVGLTCGGTIEVFLERLDAAGRAQMEAAFDEVAASRAVVVATLIRHKEPALLGRRAVFREDAAVLGSLGSTALDDVAAQTASELVQDGGATVVTVADADIFVEAILPAPRLLIFGAIELASYLASLARVLEWQVTVCDVRPVFTTTERFPEADEVVVARPHVYLEEELAAGRVGARTAVVSLTHDPRTETPLLSAALAADLAYVGAMGSRRTDEARRARLSEIGTSESSLGRLHSPIGLDLQAKTTAEIAISILGEIIATVRQGTAECLKDRKGSIHERGAVA